MRSDQEENNKQSKQRSAETVDNQSMHDDESNKEDKREKTIMNGDNISSTAASS